MERTPSGISTDARSVHEEKVSLPIEVIFSGRVTEVMPQALKAYAPMDVTLPGMGADVRAWQ